MLLTKSKYLNGLQCIKLLWISCHAPEKLKPNELQSFIFNQGHTVGDAARQLFPEGVLVESSLPFIEKINLTKDLIKQKKIIFEGSFLFNQCFCMVDILIPCNDGWELIEVKSSSSLKKVHIDDVSFQVYLLTSLGVNVTKKSVYFINTSYSLNNELSLSDVFSKSIINDNDLNLEQTKKNIDRFKKVLKNDVPNLPIGPYCNVPYSCMAKSTCWQHRSTDTIFDLVDLSIDKKFHHYYKNEIHLDDLKIQDFDKVKQKRQIACIKESLDFVDVSKIKGFLKEVTFPISFVDFECAQFAIPIFQNTAPFEQIPFMFSLHVFDGTHLKHDLYISPPNTDPRQPIIDAFKAKLPKDGTVFVFNKHSELLIFKKLNQFNNENDLFFNNVIRRLLDIQLPFKHQWIYLRSFNGKCSIKNILPALSPNDSYNQLSLSSGSLINYYYHDYIRSRNLKENTHELESYGYLDTFAMYIIYKKIVDFISDS